MSDSALTLTQLRDRLTHHNPGHDPIVTITTDDCITWVVVDVRDVEPGRVELVVEPDAELSGLR